MSFVKFLKQWEGFSAKPYQCSAGEWTIGYGSTQLNGKPVSKYTPPITEQQAEKALISHVDDHIIPFMDKYIDVPLNANQHAALVSFLYNVGTGAFGASHSLKVLNRGDYPQFAERMLLWNKAGNRPLKGLIKRREAERELFLTPAT